MRWGVASNERRCFCSCVTIKHFLAAHFVWLVKFLLSFPFLVLVKLVNKAYCSLYWPF